MFSKTFSGGFFEYLILSKKVPLLRAMESKWFIEVVMWLSVG